MRSRNQPLRKLTVKPDHSVQARHDSAVSENNFDAAGARKVTPTLDYSGVYMVVSGWNAYQANQYAVTEGISLPSLSKILALRFSSS
jgi:hypothetical protein